MSDDAARGCVLAVIVGALVFTFLIWLAVVVLTH